MSTEKVKEKIFAEIEFGGASKREILNQLNYRKPAIEVYNQMLQNGEIHEKGTGAKGDPIMVYKGWAKPVYITNAIIHINVDPAAVEKFIMRLVSNAPLSQIETIDARAHLTKALEQYVPKY